ncbi:MAG: acyl-CoA thioesterase [Gammaproteobacteria bacterium]|nr:acyl-CoA thioesterase [Gammaproteobacteria bacterium]
MERNTFSFFHELRVRTSEVDYQGIVFNAHYLTYFEVAVIEYMRHIGYNYRALVSTKGLDFHTVKATVEYLAPIGLEELIEIGVIASKIGNSSLTWTLGIYKKGQPEITAKGEIIWVCARVGAHKSHPLPEDLVQLLKQNANG